MHIKGWVKSSLVDYPGKIAASIFCGGCNFRCPNCHNSPIVLHPGDYPDVPESEIWAVLDRRTSVLDGVVISGGEPTLQPDLLAFAQRLHQRGYRVKLDTNGYLPGVLAMMIDAGAVDYVAMDIKAPLFKYDVATRVPVDRDRIQRSIDLLRQGRVEHEFRTTVVPGILQEQDIAQIAQWLAGPSCGPVRYYIQQFVPHDTLDPALLDRVPYLPQRLQAMANLAGRWIEGVEVRGI